MWLALTSPASLQGHTYYGGMEIRRLGRHGLALSALSLGTLTWGRDTDEIEAAEMLRAFVASGGSTVDVPSDWDSAAYQGRVRAVAEACRGLPREDLVYVLHSGNFPEPTSPLAADRVGRLGPRTSRRNLLASLDCALTDLETTHVDLWVIHGPRQGISVEELRDAATFAVESGRARYVGTGGLDDWDLGALTATTGTPSSFAALSGPFSLLQAGARTGAMRHGRELGMGYVALAPLAQGVLTGKYRHSTPPDSRAASAHLAALIEPYLTPRHDRVVEATVRASEGLGATAAQIALAWVLAQPEVSTAVVGPRNLRQLSAILDEPVFALQRELRDVLTEVAVG